MTVNVISVGVSILDALAEPEDKIGNADLVGAVRRAAPTALFTRAGIGEDDRRGASDWLAAALDAGGSGQRDTLAEVAATARPAEWPLHMSAETETFGHVDRTSESPFGSGDIAVLICSDTPRGLLAGVWNALKVTGDLNRVRYIPDAAARGASFNGLRGCAVLVRVPGMDAADSEGFGKAMSALGFLARRLFASGNLTKAEAFRFYLSGGFKAAIPYLVGMAEAVRSVDVDLLRPLGNAHLMPTTGPWPVSAFILHEDAEPSAPAIRLPLRRLVAESVRKELTGWETGRRTGKPDWGLLEGYAYEVTGGAPGRETYELTAFGTGLRALFGLSREGLG